MSFLTLRQQIDNWTLQEDDQVRLSLCSSSTQSRPSPMPSSNQKNKSQKIYPKLNIHYIKARSIWASALISFSKFLKSNSRKMYAFIQSENLRENFLRTRETSRVGQALEQIKAITYERSLIDWAKKLRDKIRIRRQGQYVSGDSIRIFVFNEHCSFQKHQSATSLWNKIIYLKTIPQFIH